MTLAPTRRHSKHDIGRQMAKSTRFSSFEEAAFLGLPRLLALADVALEDIDVPTMAAGLIMHRPSSFLHDECWLLPTMDSSEVRAVADRHRSHGGPLGARS